MTRLTLTAVACATLIIASFSPSVVRASGVVGSSTAASCTEAALDAALTGGGTVTFDCGGAATITVTSFPATTISADTTIDGGGVITISGGNSVDVFYANSGVNFTVQNLTIANGNFAGTTTGTGGGGIGNAGGGTLTVSNSTFSGNYAGDGTLYFGGGGGGIFNNGNSTLTVINSTFSGNTASGYGGGAILNFGTLTVTNSTFSGNSAVNDGHGGDNGGAIASYGMPAVVTNSTFSGNKARYGGGIFNDKNGGGGLGTSNGTLTVTNSTFFGNSATGGGGGGIAGVGGGTLTVTNTIIANSTSGGNCAVTVVTDGGHNIDDGTTCAFTGTGCTATTGTSFCNTNPVLDPTGLQNNGGPTQTIALCTGTGAPSAGCTGASPAINAGDESVCSTTTGTAPVDNLDQRSFVRPGTGATNCSIGAFEANSEVLEGFVPPDANTGKCEDLVAGYLKNLFACMTKCQIKQADAARRGVAFDEEACEQGTGRPVSCRTAYNNATTKLLNRNPPICPSCLNATAQSNLADRVVAFIENNNGLTYCAGATPLP